MVIVFDLCPNVVGYVNLRRGHFGHKRTRMRVNRKDLRKIIRC